MKVKDGFGNPTQTDRLQSLQSRMNSLKELNNFLNFDLRYKNGWDWRDWSAKVLIGESQNPVATGEGFHDLIKQFQVSVQCQSRWRDSFNPWPMPGSICICGHPNMKHKNGGICQAGNEICNCSRSQTALSVSDVRYFFRATKGPHEAHALVLGLNSLNLSGGSSEKTMPWVCNFGDCNRIKGVNPVRMRNKTTLAMGLSIHDKHILMCEPCLFQKLNWW
jgi:hypothetical protein